MFDTRLKRTYSVLYHFAFLFLAISFLVRLILLILSFQKADLGFISTIKVFAIGFLFDIGVVSFVMVPYAIYLLVWPSKWSNSVVNKLLTYFFFFLTVLLIMFSFFAEFTFWQEFESRFNFIAVDYLIYTYEVINNINESYPLPWLIGGMILMTSIVLFVFARRHYFKDTFTAKTSFLSRLVVSGIIIVVALLYAFVVTNDMAEFSKNRYQNELSKAGIYSFFSAFKNNELNYDHFYQRIDNNEAFSIVRDELMDSTVSFLDNGLSISRKISSQDSMMKPNVIMITIESFSAEFMGHFGNKENLTPFLDSIADHSLLFTNMYATGTRTVRGMEALTLAVPPTPGSSIVRRPNNEHLTTIGNIFRSNGYSASFFYGGDGYFDNMNKFFGNNGYKVIDRGRKLLRDQFEMQRILIPDSMIHFENAWGIADEDLYDVVIKEADQSFEQQKAFYNFVMTTSNHRPFTYPAGKIDIASGSGREGAVKYTDYAIGQFLKKIKTKPWFSNTIVVLIADHCASSAGKNEIDVSKYHIPAMVYNLPGQSGKVIDRMCSQIDLYPTLFSLLNWTYTSNLYGEDVTSNGYKQRVFLGTYQKLAYLKDDNLVILSPQQKADFFKYSKDSNTQIATQANTQLAKEAIANYQTAYFLFKNGGLKTH